MKRKLSSCPRRSFWRSGHRLLAAAYALQTLATARSADQVQTVTVASKRPDTDFHHHTDMLDGLPATT